MDSNDAMVDYLRANGRIETDRVEEAFRNVERADYVPENYRDQAYQDHAVPIGDGATISAPHMVAINTELLEVEEESRVLEIGSGSGYQLAVLSELAREVTGVEIKEELVKRSRQALEGRENVRVLHGSGLDAVEGDFDRILYSCAIDSLERAKDRLEEGGIIVAPVSRGRIQRLKRFRDGKTEDHGAVRFVDFIDGQ